MMRFYPVVKISVTLLALLLFCCCLPTSATELAIPDAKLLPDNSSVSLSAKVITYVSANFFYIEEDSRNMGIRVEKTAHGLAVGMRADVSGTMMTKANTERYIQASSAVHNGDAVIAPVSLKNPAVGGGDWQVAGSGGQCGVSCDLKSCTGLNNVGLLVKVYGKYQSYPRPSTFTVNDGSGVYVKCMYPSGMFIDPGWKYVCVTGVISISGFRDYSWMRKYPPTILVRDIVVWAIGNPGVPTGNTSPAVNIPYTYTTTGSTCTQGHTIEYSFDWGDGTSSPWSVSPSASHSWITPGAKSVTVAARCQDCESVGATSSALTVNVVDFTYTGEMVSSPAEASLWEIPAVNQHPLQMSFLSIR